MYRAHTCTIIINAEYMNQDMNTIDHSAEGVC